MNDFKQILFKLCFAIVISGYFTTGMPDSAIAIDNEYNNQLMNINVNKTGSDSVDVTVYSSKPYNMKITPIKRSNNEYVIVLPQTYHSITSKPDTSSSNGAVSDVDVKLLPYVGASSNNGYTRITIKTAPNVSVNVHNKAVNNKHTVDPELMNLVNERNKDNSTKQEVRVVKKTEERIVTSKKAEKTVRNIQKAQETIIKPAKPKTEKTVQKPIKPLQKQTKQVVKKQPVKQQVVMNKKEIKEVKTPVVAKETKINKPKSELANVNAQINLETNIETETPSSIIDELIGLTKKYPNYTIIILGISSLLMIFKTMVGVFTSIATRKRNKLSKVASGKDRINLDNANRQLYNSSLENKIQEKQNATDFDSSHENIKLVSSTTENESFKDTLSKEYRDLEFPEEDHQAEEQDNEEDLQKIVQEIDHDFDDYYGSQEIEESQDSENYEVYEYGKSQPEFIEQQDEKQEIEESESQQTEEALIEEEKNPEDDLDVVSEKEISENKMLYLVNFEGQLTLLGAINSEIYVLHKFDREINKTNIYARFNEHRDNQDIYLVQIESWRALIGINNDNMELLLAL